MSATAVVAVAGTGVTVALDVTSTVTRLALSYVIDQAGWDRCDHATPCRCLRVADHLGASSRRVDIVVTRAEPAACHDAIQAVVAGRARAIILNDEPEQLGPTVDALVTGRMTMPQRALELSLAAPRLSGRQRDTLRLLATGRSSRAIASAMHQSESTAKRDIAELLQVFDVPNRTALVAYATRLGFLDPAPALVST